MATQSGKSILLEKATLIRGLKNNSTGQIIYSRSQHDCRWDDDRKVMVDGGFTYLKLGWDPKADFAVVEFTLPVTQKELYDDWNLGTDKYGSLTAKQAQNIEIKEMKINGNE